MLVCINTKLMLNSEIANNYIHYVKKICMYRLYDEGEVVTRFIHRVPKARGV